MARVLAQHGARVVLGSRSGSELEEPAVEIGAPGGEVAFRVTDVTSATDVEALRDRAVERFGRRRRRGRERRDRAERPPRRGGGRGLGPDDRCEPPWPAAHRRRCRPGTPFTRLRPLRHRRLDIGSDVGAGQGVYAATKPAARGLTDVLHQELAPAGVRVTCIAPGFTSTGFVESTRDPEERAVLEARRDAIAMPPSAFAEAVLFALAQPDAVDVGELTVRPTIQQ